LDLATNQVFLTFLFRIKTQRLKKLSLDEKKEIDQPMMKNFGYFLFLLVITLYSPVFFSTTNAMELKQEGITQLQSVITEDPLLKGAIAGISIRSTTTGEILYSYNGETSLTPASSFKLFTATAALTTLGLDYTYQTEVSTDGKWNKKGIVKGNLYLIGRGDPTLTVKDLNILAKQLRKKGIRTIAGDVIADDTWYDKVRYSIDLPWSDESAYYGAQISALTVSPNEDYDAGTIIVQVTPSKKGKKPKTTLSPNTDYMVIHNKANTTEAGSNETLKITRGHGKNELVIEGTIPEDGSITQEWISVWDPTKYTLDLFKEELEREGIHVKGDCYIGKAADKTLEIVTHKSEPLSEILIPFLKLSNNTIAEMLVKEMGKVTQNLGTWEAGLETEKRVLTQLGVDINNMVFRDGSGISHLNTTQANTVTQLLYRAQLQEWFPAFYKALPVAGEKEKIIGGTLRKRMTKSSLKQKVIAKTGTLTNVSSISGYMQTKSGENVIFSIVINHLQDDKEVKKVEDKILTVMLNYLE